MLVVLVVDMAPLVVVVVVDMVFHLEGLVESQWVVMVAQGLQVDTQ